MEFSEIVKERYATKQFDPNKKVSQENLDKLLEIIRLAPSSFGLQPWKIIVISNQELKEKLLPVSWNQPQIKDCSHLLVFCADTHVLKNIQDFQELMISEGSSEESIKDYIDMMKGFENGLSKEAKTSWAQKQTYIALANAVNGSKSLGFDSCPMEGFSPEEYSKILELPENIIPTTVCTVGYALSDADKKPKIRFSKERVFEFRD